MKSRPTGTGSMSIHYPHSGFMRQSGRGAVNMRLEAMPEVHNRAQRRRILSQERKNKCKTDG